eukprot:6474752-Amphidinium_carterae.1
MSRASPLSSQLAGDAPVLGTKRPADTQNMGASSKRKAAPKSSSLKLYARIMLAVMESSLPIVVVDSYALDGNLEHA